MRRGHVAAKGRPSRPLQTASSSGRTRKLEGRLKSVEQRLSHGANTSITPGSATSLTPAPPNHHSNSDDTTMDARSKQAKSHKTVMETRALGLVETPLHHHSGLPHLMLPQREELLPEIDHYFRHTNQFIPLFHRASFMRIFDSWYSNPETQTQPKWAAIHIVMALGLRTPEPEASEQSTGRIQRANTHLNNAQSVLSELVIRDEDLLGIQVLLGIIILLNNSSNQKPSSVIIASVIRLAHRLLLHSRASAQYFTEEEALQRSRVFWIAYTLDKEISLRVKIPSIQSDEDIDLPLPEAKPLDGVGLIQTRDGADEINLFRLRVQLAHIQGKIYDLLYSNRAATIEGPKRRQLIAEIQAKVNDWYHRIPLAFSIEHVLSMVGPGELVQMTKLHHGYLMAEIMTHGFYSRDAEWLKRISSVSSITMQGLTSTQDQFGAARGDTGQDPPSPSGWNKLVDISRGCLKLFHAATQIESLAWQCSCGHFSSLLVLLANMFLHPAHPYSLFDQRLTSISISFCDNILEGTLDKAFESVREVIRELAAKANTAVEHQKLYQDANNADTFLEFLPQWSMPSLLDDWNSPTFSTDPSMVIDVFGTDGFGATFE